MPGTVKEPGFLSEGKQWIDKVFCPGRAYILWRRFNGLLKLSTLLPERSRGSEGLGFTL